MLVLQKHPSVLKYKYQTSSSMIQEKTVVSIKKTIFRIQPSFLEKYFDFLRERNGYNVSIPFDMS